MLTQGTDVTGSVAASLFVAYAMAGVVAFFLYRRLRPLPPIDLAEGARHGLDKSRAIVLRLAGLFAVDSFGGGFTGQAIIVLWLSLRYDMSTATAGAVSFWSGLFTAGSALLAPRLAGRIGLIRTMVYTHLPANALLISAASCPPSSWPWRACWPAHCFADGRPRPHVLCDGDGGAGGARRRRQRHQRPPQPRHRLPTLAGWMLAKTTFGWPLVIGGTLKAVYDLPLLRLFRDVRPPEELALPNQ